MGVNYFGLPEDLVLRPISFRDPPLSTNTKHFRKTSISNPLIRIRVRIRGQKC